MKKLCIGTLKLVVTLAVLGIAIYAIVTYWDKIMELLGKAKVKLCEVKDACRGSEYDDYADDWD